MPAEGQKVIKVDGKFPSAANLTRAAFAEIEKQIASKARSAAARHGGVTVRSHARPTARARLRVPGAVSGHLLRLKKLVNSLGRS